MSNPIARSDLISLPKYVLESDIQELQLPTQAIESLLFTLILDERIKGRLNQVDQSLELPHIQDDTAPLLRGALLQGTSEILQLSQALVRSFST